MSEEHAEITDQLGRDSDRSEHLSIEEFLERTDVQIRLVFPVLYSGSMPQAIEERKAVNTATRRLCLSAERYVDAIRYAQTCLTEAQLEELEMRLNP